MLLFWSCKSPRSCNLLPTTSTDQALSVVVVTVVVTTCRQFCESLPYWIISNNRFTHPPRHPPTPKKKWITTLNLGHLKGFSFSARARFFEPISSQWVLSYRSFCRQATVVLVVLFPCGRSSVLLSWREKVVFGAVLGLLITFQITSQMPCWSSRNTSTAKRGF